MVGPRKHFDIFAPKSTRQPTFEVSAAKHLDSKSELLHIAPRVKPRSRSVSTRRSKYTKYHRTLSAGPRYCDNHEVSYQSLPKMVYERVKNELEKAQIDSDVLISTVLERFLPQHDTPEQHLDVLQRFDTRPITVSDRELSQIFRIKESTAKSTASPGSICYLRSWRLPKVILQVIMDSIQQDELDFGPMESWTSQIRDLSDSDNVFIRYIGQTTAPSTPWMRVKTATKGNNTSPVEVFATKVEQIARSYCKFRVY